MFGPELAGPRIKLRPPALRDLPRFRRWYADPEIVRYWWMGDVAWAAHPGIATARLFLGALFKSTSVVWTIERGSKPIGHCHIRDIDRVNGHASTALLIGDKAEQHNGYACEAIALRSDFAFGQLGLHKLKSSTRADNAGGRRMLEKSGYRLVGTAREDAYVDKEWRDVLLFELHRSDHQPPP